jgi:hypothetical protein
MKTTAMYIVIGLVALAVLLIPVAVIATLLGGYDTPPAEEIEISTDSWNEYTLSEGYTVRIPSEWEELSLQDEDNILALGLEYDVYLDVYDYSEYDFREELQYVQQIYIGEEHIISEEEITIDGLDAYLIEYEMGDPGGYYYKGLYLFTNSDGQLLEWDIYYLEEPLDEEMAVLYTVVNSIEKQ